MDAALADAEQAALRAHAQALASHGGALRIIPAPLQQRTPPGGPGCHDRAPRRHGGAGHGLDGMHRAGRSPWNEGTCRASFLDCFHCGNALITRTHLPRLLSLAEALEQRRAQMNTDAWWRRYGPAWEAIRHHVLPEFSAAEVQAARRGQASRQPAGPGQGTAGGAVSTPAVTAAAAPATSGQCVLHGRELRDGTVLEHTSRFADERWVLTPAILQRHERSLVLDFTLLPAAHRTVARELFCGLLPGPLPPGLPRVSITTIRKIFTAVRYFLRSVAGRAAGDPPPAALARLRPADLDDFHRHLVTTTRARGLRAHYRASVRLFWHYRATLSDPLPFDPVCLDAWGEPNHSARGENRTARIPEPVMGPLLAWALQFTDDFAPDILAAAAEALALHNTQLNVPGRRLRPGVLEELLADSEREHRPLPGFRGQVNATFLARKLGCYPSTLRRSPLLAAAAARTGIDTGTYLDTQVGFRLDGRPWLDRIAYSNSGYDSLGTLARMLQTACYILIAYLTGMRDSEIKHLTRGCARCERDSNGTAYRQKITGLAFKGENDPRGVPATWIAGHPAARAVAVLERLQPPGQPLLFARLPYREGTRPASSNAALTTAATQQALADFTGGSAPIAR